MIIPISAQESHTIRLLPTDDTFIISNQLNSDSRKNMQKNPSGLDEVMSSWYSWDFSPGKKIFAISYMKFNLENITPEDIVSAKLLLNVEKTTIVDHSPNVSIYSLNSTSWSEENFVYAPNIISDKKISDTELIFQPDLYEWDITQYVIDNAGTQIAITAQFSKVVSGNLELISFTTKESELNIPPVLEIKTLSEQDFLKSPTDSQKTYEQKITEFEKKIGLLEKELINIKKSPNYDSISNEIIELTPTDDSFVVIDYNTPQEQNKIKDRNFGSVQFLRMINSWNGTGINEKITSPVFLKFNLTDINMEKIQSAELKMYPFVVDAYNSTSLAVLQVSENNWSENQITASNSPLVDKKPIDSIDISDSHTWYSWNVTNNVIAQTDSEISFALIYTTMEKDRKENISFYSKDSTGNKLPHLEIQYTEKTNESGGCLIATATYGSELAPQVQQLRELRDNTLLNTKSGTAFMSTFNNAYYSFSPVIADMERESPILKEIVKVGLTPMLSSLSLMENANSESEVLGMGLSVIMLNIGMYIAAPALIGMKVHQQIKSRK